MLAVAAGAATTTFLMRECRVYGWMTDGTIRLDDYTAEMFSNLPSVTRMMRSLTSGTDCRENEG